MTEPATEPMRTALVVGGSRGIGAAITTRLMRDGCQVASLSRSGTGPPGSVGITADLADPSSLTTALRRVTAEFGEPGILVVAAGAMAVRPLLMTGDELFERILAVNVVGPEHVIRRVAVQMAERGYGRIAVLSSLSGVLGAAGQVAYAVAKSALIGLAIGMAAEYAEHNITVNIVVPGFVATEMTAGLPAEIRAVLGTANPRGRPASCDEVATAVSYLTRPEAGVVSGTVVMADFGEWASGQSGRRVGLLCPVPSPLYLGRCQFASQH